MANRIKTKSHYESIINETLLETQDLINKFPELPIYKSIYDQILQIREDVLVRNLKMTLFEIIDKYTLGGIAVKNFDLGHDIYAQKLSDIAGLSYKYQEMPE